ncbi:MAG TPA: response regulator, partial [Gemmatimonadaceae bacterium]|nr:response regulator [Gemmatimonadaceae bacterium]
GRPAPPGDWVYVSVADTGDGMSAEMLARIFEPFFTTKKAGAGTGLGLASVEGAVSQNGGRVAVASAPGEGTTFTVFLPRVTAGHADAVRSAPVPTPLGGETILVVEDDGAVRMLAERMLRSLGYAVLSAANGETALALARDHDGPIDLVLTDVIMPGMNGRQLADALTALRPNIRVLHTSGYTADHIARHGVLDEGVEFLPKPYSIDELGQRVRRVLDRARSPASAD